MKKDKVLLEAYIKNVCKGISDRKVKNELRDELLSHLLEIYERNIALGMSDEDAQKDAVAHMGDSEAVSKTFKQIYPVSTVEFLKEKAWNMVLPIVYLFVYDNGSSILFPGLFIVTLAFTLADFKKINKWFHRAFITSIIALPMQTAMIALYEYYIFDKEVRNTNIIISQILIFIIYTLILAGVLKFKKQLKAPKKDILLVCLSFPLLFIGCILVYFTQVYNVFFFIAALLFNALPAILIYTTVKDFESSDKFVHKGKSKGVLKRSTITIIILLITCGIVHGIMSRPPEYKNFVVDDTTIDIAEIKQNIISLGLPENIANDLPESEILNYENAYELEIIVDEDFNDFLSEHTDDISEFERPYYTAYAFHLKSEDKPLKIRVLFVLNGFDCYNKLYHDDFLIRITNNSELEIDSNTLKNHYFKILCDYNGKTIETEPFNMRQIEDYENLFAYNFGFIKDAKNTRIYSAQTITPSIENEVISVRYNYRNYSLPTEYNSRWFWISEFYDVYIENPCYVPNSSENNSSMLEDVLSKYKDEYSTNQYIDDEMLDLDNIN